MGVNPSEVCMSPPPPPPPPPPKILKYSNKSGERGQKIMSIMKMKKIEYAYLSCKQIISVVPLLWYVIADLTWDHPVQFISVGTRYSTKNQYQIRISIIGIKIRRWALLQIYSRDVGVCCKSWGRQVRSFATNTHGKAMNRHQCSVAGLNGYYSEFEW